MKTEPVQILFPGEDAWELWSMSPATGVPEKQGEIGSDSLPHFSGPSSRRVLALPVASTYAIPLWVFAQNDEELRGAVELHLEKDGLSRADEPAGFDFERVAADEKRVLIRIDALAKASVSLAEESAVPDTVCLAPKLLALPKNQVVVWKELGKCVAALTRDGKLVYHNVIASSCFDARALEEVIRWAKQFQFQGILPPPDGITIWADRIHLEAQPSLPFQLGVRPAPRFQADAATRIAPRFLVELRRLEDAKRRNRRLFAGGALFAGLLMLGFLAAMALSLQHQRVLLGRIAALSPAAAEIEQIQQRWAEVAAAVDPDRSPLEMMLLIHQIPNATEVTLTRFERSGDRLALQGKAASPAEALRFLGAISKSSKLAIYRWSYPQPLIAQDGSATFEIEGILAADTP